MSNNNDDNASSSDQKRDPHPHALRNATVLILIGEVIGAIVFFIAFSVITGEPGTKCGWCSENGFDLALRKVLLFKDVQAAAVWSHRFSIMFLPLFALAGTVGPALLSTRRRFAAQDATIIIAAFVWVTAICDGVKKITSRERPGFHFGEQAMTEAADHLSEQFLSFFSGDTAWAFVFFACSTTIAYYRGYRTAPWLAGIGAVAAIIAGALRVSANMHWPSDVLVGALVGCLVGAGIPYVLHRRHVLPEAPAVAEEQEEKKAA